MQTRLRRLERGPTGESGAVLILSLLLLMVLTLLGVAALTSSRIELQLAANDRAHKQALAAADVALSIGETVIESWTDPAELDEDASADDGRYGIGEQPAWGYLQVGCHLRAARRTPAAAVPRRLSARRLARRNGLRF